MRSVTVSAVRILHRGRSHLHAAVKLAAILPWIAFLFGATSSVLSFAGARAVSDDERSDSTSTEGIDEEKRGNVRAEERRVQ